MQLLVQFQVLDAVIGVDSVAHLRSVVQDRFGKIQESGKVVSSGIFAKCRGGYLVLNVAGSAGVLNLLGSAMVDHFRNNSHPVVSLARIIRRVCVAREVTDTVCSASKLAFRSARFPQS